jgi:DNA-binding MarR family transcriptional regulator
MQETAESASRARSSSVESVMHALMSIGRLMRQRSTGETLDTGSFWMLKTIGANDSIRVTDLATCVNLDTSTVSRHVAQLHSAGLIERTSDPVDRRAQRVKLSSRGERQLNAAVRARLALLERSLEGWAPDDLEQLDRLMTRFVGDIDNLTKNSENR